MYVYSESEYKIKQAGLAVVLTLVITFFTTNFNYLFIFYSNEFLLSYSLIKCQNIVGRT